jgi:hypothetical protein
MIKAIIILISKLQKDSDKLICLNKTRWSLTDKKIKDEILRLLKRLSLANLISILFFYN